MKLVNLCAISMDSRLYGQRDKAALWKEALSLLETARLYTPDIILFPEIFLIGGHPERWSDARYIEQAGSSQLVEIGRIASDLRAYVAAPVLYRDTDGVHNSVVVFDRLGRHVYTYHKAFPTAQEVAHGVVAGPSQPAVLETDFGRVGFAICFDLNFDELLAHYQREQISLLLFPSYLPGGFLLQRAAWNGRFFAASAHAQGVESVVVDDYGRVVTRGNLFTPVLFKQLNLDTAILHIDENVDKVPAMLAALGRNIEIEMFRAEGLMRLTCWHPERHIADVIREFQLIPLSDYLDKARKLER
jgi:predicted amidohydrolase